MAGDNWTIWSARLRRDVERIIEFVADVLPAVGVSELPTNEGTVPIFDLPDLKGQQRTDSEGGSTGNPLGEELPQRLENPTVGDTGIANEEPYSKSPPPDDGNWWGECLTGTQKRLAYADAVNGTETLKRRHRDGKRFLHQEHRTKYHLYFPDEGEFLRAKKRMSQEK